MTAEECLKSKGYVENATFPFNGVSKVMIEFAKYHVEKALEEFTKKIETERVKHHYPPILFINKTDIESSYPLENIK